MCVIQHFVLLVLKEKSSGTIKCVIQYLELLVLKEIISWNNCVCVIQYLLLLVLKGISSGNNQVCVIQYLLLLVLKDKFWEQSSVYYPTYCVTSAALSL